MYETFQTELESKDVDVYNFEKSKSIPDLIDIEINCSATVYWTFEVEGREWGVKDISASVTRLKCLLEHSCYGDELTETDKEALKAAGMIEQRNGDFEGSVEIDTLLDDSWTIESEMEIQSTICPGNVEIDFKTKVIQIT